MTLPPLQIRPARLEDAESLAVLAARSFRDAFASENSAEDIQAYVSGSFSIERLRAELLDHNERWGFETVGEHVFRLSSDDQTDLIMQRAVVPQEGDVT